MENDKNETKVKLKFHIVKDPTLLISILEERHPLSCMMKNQVTMFSKFKGELEFYTVGQEINSDTWIVSNNIREDYSCNYNISAPSAISLGNKPIPKEIIECFASDQLIKWSGLGDLVGFLPMPVPVSRMIVEIAANEMGHVTEIHPCYLYFMERDTALNLETSNEDPNLEVRRFDVAKNEADFILKTWKYALPGSEKVLPECIAKNASGGVFLKGKCVCGVYIPAVGFLSALYTLKEHRNKGYGVLVMKYTFKQFAEDGCIPCLTAELQNSRSIKFHQRLGLKVAAKVNGILVKKLDID